jgi:hypothetical protein
MYGKYIYGIIVGGGDITLGARGVGGANLVYTIANQGLSCVVSNYSGKDFRNMSKEELVRCLLAHQVVVEQVMRRHTVLPVKFGTVLATSDEVSDLLAQGYSQFSFMLLWMQDKVELEVTATWDKGRVLAESGTEPKIVPTEEATAGRLEQYTQQERLQLEQVVKDSMAQRRSSYLERMIGFLQPVSVDVQPNTLGSEEMAMNVAFLVERGKLEVFDNRLRQLNDLFSNQIDFRIIGPLPPYSFATVEATRPDSGEIKKARKLLNLGDVVSELEVRKAYHRLTREAHPDRRRGSELTRTRRDELRRASDRLVAHHRGQAESGGSFLIYIRRSRSDEVQPSRLVEIGA